MRSSLKHASWLLTLLPLLPLLQGCDQKAQVAQQQPQALAPPIVDAPPPKPATVTPADLPPPVLGNTPPADTKPVTAPPPEPPKKPVHHPKKPAQPPASSTQETASVAPAPSVPATPTVTEPSEPAAGQLSGGASGGLRTETEETINSTEKGVNGITRTLSDSETKTAAQIREFLKQAKDALTTGDVDGAHTLAMKAKVLLAELNQ